MSEIDSSFCENVNRDQLKTIGLCCGLEIGDWARSTRWVNLPDIASYENKHVCNASVAIKAYYIVGMFFEVPTIWKEKKATASSVPSGPDDVIKTNTLKRSRSSGTGKISKNRTLPKWRPRRIGIFFSQNHNPREENSVINKNAWTCLILVEPIENSDNFVFCYRKIATQTGPDNPRPNARCLPGRRRYTIEEANIQETINYIVQVLLDRHFIKDQASSMQQKCGKFFTELGKDIFWGWEEFATQVVQFSAVWPLQIYVHLLGL